MEERARICGEGHRRGCARSWLTLAGAVIYLAGAIGVTIACNVPLNDRIDRVDPAGPTAAEEWRRFDRPWRAWNHVRTVSSLAATAAMIAAPAS